MPTGLTTSGEGTRVAAEATAAPAESAGAVPGESAGAVPGESAGAVPGESAGAVPGASLACNGIFEADQANCTLAININIAPVANAATPAALVAGLHPADLQSAYALPVNGSGRTVAIVDAMDDPSAESDLAVYRSTFGLPACTSANGCFLKVNERGSPASFPSPDLGWGEEISLDLDMVSAICPGCKILLVEADSSTFDDLGASVDEAVALGASAVSNSDYGPEWSGEAAYDAHYHHPGVAITVSSGDERSPFYPAASPYVTSVGGTSLSGGPGAWSAQPWQYGGAGCSAYEPRQAWQGQTGCRSRSTVDMAAVADPQTGVSMFDSTAGGWYVVGGTSVAAPIVAAAYALSGNAQGPAFSYSHRSGFNDIAPAGYDQPTGLGTISGLSGL